MIDTIMESFRRKEASHARDLAYLMEDMEDDTIDACLEMAESDDPMLESAYDAEDPEIQEMLEHMDELDDGEEDEVNRIMEATEGLSFDQMIGLEPVEEASSNEE